MLFSTQFINTNLNLINRNTSVNPQPTHFAEVVEPLALGVKRSQTQTVTRALSLSFRFWLRRVDQKLSELRVELSCDAALRRRQKRRNIEAYAT